MKSIIKELWHGNIIPQDDSRINSKEMKELPWVYGAASRGLREKLHGRAERNLRELHVAS